MSCTHTKLRFNAATVFMKKNEQNGEIGIVAICDACGKTWVGDVEAGLSNAWTKQPQPLSTPIGLMPKDIWEEKRYQAIMDAMVRYNVSDMIVPQEWLEEAIELRRKIEARINKRDPKKQTYGG